EAIHAPSCSPEVVHGLADAVRRLSECKAVATVLKARLDAAGLAAAEAVTAATSAGTGAVVQVAPASDETPSPAKDVPTGSLRPVP
ncbi:hypothetical protein LW979_17685, partial [Erwinia amylovora]|uniref:hypothetical protein n=1 Tax=Erwinia amylovora TaxID=552 RepID=UPI0020BE0EBF